METVTTTASGRDRIRQYVDEERQLFFLSDPNTSFVVLEDPSTEPIVVNNVWWICPPRHVVLADGVAGNANDEKLMYDHVMAYGMTYRPGSADLVESGATASALSPHGYVASWNPPTQSYQEYLTDFDDTSWLTFS